MIQHHATAFIVALGCCGIVQPVCADDRASPLIESVRAAMEAEAAQHLAARAPLEGARRSLFDSAVQYRVLIVELLDAARDADETGHAAAVMAMRLFEARDELDAMLNGLDSVFEAHEELDGDANEADDIERAERIADHLDRFNRAMRDRREPIRSGTRSDLQAQLIPILAPLTDAVMDHTGDPLPRRWIVINEDGEVVRPRPHDLSGGANDALLRELSSLRDAMRADHNAALRAAIDEEAAAALNVVLDSLERAAGFPEFHARTHRLMRALQRAEGAARTLHRAAWLSDHQRVEYHADLRSIIIRFEQPESREQSLRMLVALERNIDLIKLLNELSERHVDDNSVRLLHDAVYIPVTASLEAADSLVPRAMLQPLLVRLVESRDLSFENIPHALDAIDRRLHNRYDDAEQALFQSLARVTNEPDRSLDELESRIGEHEIAHHMRLALALVPRLIDTTVQIDAQQSHTAERRIIQNARLLLDPSRRRDAAKWLETLAAEMQHYAPAPFERALREPSRAAVKLTGGRQGELVRELDDLRRAWLTVWIRPGRSSQTDAERLRKLHAMLRVFDDAATLVEHEPEELATRLNSWALWLMPDEVVQRFSNATTGRAPLAVHSYLEGEAEVFDAELAALEWRGGPGRIIGRLARQLLNNPRDASPLLGTLGDLTILPPGEVWMDRQQERIAHFCRLALEVQATHDAGDATAAERFQERANAVASELMRTIGESNR